MARGGKRTTRSKKINELLYPHVQLPVPHSFFLRDTGITHRLFTLPDDTVVYPGHGPPTTIGAARAEYAAFAARAQPADLHGDVTWAG